LIHNKWPHELVTIFLHDSKKKIYLLKILRIILAISVSNFMFVSFRKKKD